MVTSNLSFLSPIIVFVLIEGVEPLLDHFLNRYHCFRAYLLLSAELFGHSICIIVVETVQAMESMLCTEINRYHNHAAVLLWFQPRILLTIRGILKYLLLRAQLLRKLPIQLLILNVIYFCFAQTGDGYILMWKVEHGASSTRVESFKNLGLNFICSFSFGLNYLLGLRSELGTRSES